MSASLGAAEHRVFAQHSRTSSRALNDPGGSSRTRCSTRNAVVRTHGAPSRLEQPLRAHRWHRVEAGAAPLSARGHQMEARAAPSSALGPLSWGSSSTFERRGGTERGLEQPIRAPPGHRAGPCERTRGQSTAGAVFSRGRSAESTAGAVFSVFSSHIGPSGHEARRPAKPALRARDSYRNICIDIYISATVPLGTSCVSLMPLGSAR